MNLISSFKSPYLRFSNEVGSQDILKALALLTMILDHLGLYFFPDESWLRSVGRNSHIIWLFFVGYNFKENTKLLGTVLYCAVFVLIIRDLYHLKLLPLNILFTIIICRMALKLYLKNAVKDNVLNELRWNILVIICISLTPLANLAFEYGTVGFLIAIYGYNLKHKVGNLLSQSILLSIIITIGNINVLKSTYDECILRLIVINLTMYILYKFKPITFNIHGIMKYIINISARYSLYLYCMHLLVFLFIKQNLL